MREHALMKITHTETVLNHFIPPVPNILARSDSSGTAILQGKMNLNVRIWVPITRSS